MQLCRFFLFVCVTQTLGSIFLSPHRGRMDFLQLAGGVATTSQLEPRNRNEETLLSVRMRSRAQYSSLGCKASPVCSVINTIIITWGFWVWHFIVHDYIKKACVLTPKSWYQQPHSEKATTNVCCQLINILYSNKCVTSNFASCNCRIMLNISYWHYIKTIGDRASWGISILPIKRHDNIILAATTSCQIEWQTNNRLLFW